ncbi:hypothetical protein ACCS54_18765 [Rhizobium johnstonii]|uniref:hypothetical protein n=1 Tax=Rhizobium johnstonii TaxID=3019933 RepID=UPI003F979D0A
MRQIAAFGKISLHNGIDDRVVYQQVGFVWQWRFLLRAWEKFERHEILQNDRGFTDIWNVVRGAHRERFYAEDIVLNRLNGAVDTAIFVHPMSLRELAAGCQELRGMLDADAAGEFLGFAANPLLEPIEEHNVRLLIRRVMQMEDRRVVQFPRRTSEAGGWIAENLTNA